MRYDAANPAAMTERLIDAAVYAETAAGVYRTGAMKELSDARAAIEQAITTPAASPARDDLVSRAEVLRVIRSLGDQDADLALYGAADNARAREYGEAAATRACCAIALMPPATPSPAPAAVEVEGLVARLERARTGYAADALPLLEQAAAALAAEAKCDALREALAGTAEIVESLAGRIERDGGRLDMSGPAQDLARVDLLLPRARALTQEQPNVGE